MLLGLLACAPVQVTGEIDGYEVPLAEAVYVEAEWTTEEDEDVPVVAVFVVDFEDSCNRLTEYFDAMGEAEDELWDAENDDQVDDALEEMDEAEELMPARYWRSLVVLAVDSYGEGAVSDMALRGIDTEDEVEDAGDAQLVIGHQTDRPDWEECWKNLFDGDDCELDLDEYFSDGGSGTVTSYTPNEVIKFEFTSDFREWDMAEDEPGDKVGSAELSIEAAHCSKLETLYED